MKTKRLVFLLIPLILFILFSCDNHSNIPGKKVIISVASDYYDTASIGHLKNTINDQAGFISQMSALIPDSEIYMFRSERGTKYISQSVINLETSATPVFKFKASPDKGVPNYSEENLSPALYLDTSIPNTVVENNWALSDVVTLILELDLSDDDILIFHYSGHGADQSGDLIGGTTSFNNSSYVVLDTLPAQSLLTILNQKNGLKLLFIDSCFSGNFIKDGILSSADRLSEKEENGSKMDIYTYTSILHSFDSSIDVLLGSTKSGNPDIYVISACTKNQLSYDSTNAGLPNQDKFGTFSYYLLRALGYDASNLKGAKNKGMITFYSLYKDLWDSFPNDIKYGQTPRSTLSPIDVVIAF